MAEPYWLTGKLSTDAEFRRLEQLALQYNHAVKVRMQQLGVGPGSRVLEIGPGSGSFVRWLVEEGAVVTAVDLTDEYFATFRHRRVTTLTGDVRTADLGGRYDFVVAQMVLHHLPERLDVVRRLAASLKPGGWLVANEPDTSLLWTHGGPSAPVDVLRRLCRRFAALGVDYEWGLQLPAAFSAAGLVDVTAGVFTPVITPASDNLRLWRLGWPVFRELATSRDWATAEELDEAEAGLDAPDLLASSVPAVLCAGRAPGAEERGD